MSHIHADNLRLAAPANAPAWYDVRHCLMRSTRDNAVSIFEALQSGDLQHIQFGAELLHELVHLAQDISTGWGFYQSELTMALFVAQAGVLTSLVHRTGILDAPIESSVRKVLAKTATYICPHEYQTRSDFLSLWREFSTRSDADLGLFEIDVIESHAHSYQVLEHLIRGDASAVNDLLAGGTDEYTKAMNMTARSLGIEGSTSPNGLLLLLLCHQTFCEIALSVPPPQNAPRVPPAFVTPQILSRLMPESLSGRFHKILNCAANNLRPMTSDFVSNGGSLDRFELLLRHIRNYSNWLRKVSICEGSDLSEAWLSIFASPAEMTKTEVSEMDDPIRAYRGWGMSHWRPSAQSEQKNQLLRLMSMVPAFRLATPRIERWYFELDQERARSAHLNAVTAQEFLGRVSADLSARLVMSELPRYFVDGSTTEVSCPYFAECKDRQDVCTSSFARGIRQGCRAMETVHRAIRVRIATVDGAPLM